MENKTNNKLFILLTDACTLNCDFCYFGDRREDKCNKKGSNEKIKCIDVNKGYARESLSELIGRASVIGLSGSGEPLLNIEGLIGVLSLTNDKRFIITTNGSFEPLRLSSIINNINDVCRQYSNTCILRLSVDKFHSNSKNYQDNLENLLKWYMADKWERCKSLFFRTNIIDEDYIENKFKKICLKNNWDFEWDKSKDIFAKFVKINKKEFRIIFRPIVNAGDLKIKDRYTVYEYSDLLSKSDGHEIKIGVPKGCQGCLGCKEDGVLACQVLDGLDITIDTDGSVYLYGGEISSLGSIYNEKLNYDIISKRLQKNKLYNILLNNPLKKIVNELAKDKKFKNIIENTNYPYHIIKNINKANPKKLKNLLLNLATEQNVVTKN